MTAGGESANPGRGEYALVCAADDAFAMPLAVAVVSALERLSPAVRPEIFVLDNGISESSRNRLRRAIDVQRPGIGLRWLSVPEGRLGTVPSDSHFTAATYSRLLIPELVPEHIRRAVYLDADVLVRRDLAPLFTIPLGGAVIGAVRDSSVGSTADELSGVREDGDPRPYYNSGLLVIDVGGWRSTGLADRALRYAAAGPPLRWADQDALNAVVERWHELDRHWNVQRKPGDGLAVGLRERWKLYRATAVLHFIGPSKPWQYTCITTGAAAWVRALVRSRWHTRGEALVWLGRWFGRRVWYRGGNAARRLSAARRQRSG